MLASSPWNSFVTAKDAFTPCASIGNYYPGAEKAAGIAEIGSENTVCAIPFSKGLRVR
jgi:hypothetical protein